MKRTLAVMVYARRGDEVLIMHRNKNPNFGLWIAPGGKIEEGESPQDAARREMVEETGLVVEDLQLQGICTEVSAQSDWEWLLFIFDAFSFRGDLCADLREGDLAWVPVDVYLDTLAIPQADVIFAPRILNRTSPLFQAKFIYDADLKLVEWIAY